MVSLHATSHKNHAPTPAIRNEYSHHDFSRPLTRQPLRAAQRKVPWTGSPSQTGKFDGQVVVAPLAISMGGQVSASAQPAMLLQPPHYAMSTVGPSAGPRKPARLRYVRDDVGLSEAGHEALVGCVQPVADLPTRAILLEPASVAADHAVHCQHGVQ